MAEAHVFSQKALPMETNGLRAALASRGSCAGAVPDCPGQRWGLSETTQGLPYVGGRCDEAAEGEGLSLDGKATT